jgi:pSer/pThr/pTyr-binding forkhead associated (FHA) protein
MWIVIESGPAEGEAAEVTGQLLVGSDASCDLPIQAPDVAPRHAVARAAGGILTLMDLDAPAGTFINGERLQGTRALAPGDRIRIGESTLVVSLEGPGSVVQPTADTPVPPVVPVPPPPSVVPEASEAPGTGEPASRRRGTLIAAAVVVLLIAGIAIALAAGGSKTPAKSTPPPLAITTFTATATSPIQADLSWAATGDGISTFTVSRDGVTLTTLPATSSSYQDTTAKPRKEYTYTIQAATSKDKHSDPATATVTMPAPPPLKAARVSGRFDVHTVFLSESYVNKHVGQKEYTVWGMKPKCGEGPCNVSVKTFAPGQTSTVLVRSGGRYKGKGTDLFSVCGSGSNRIRTTVAIDVHVTAARYVQGVWRATKFGGVMSRNAPSAFGCLSASSRLSVSGQLQNP